MLDKELILSDAQDFATVTAGTTASTNYLDLVKVGDSISPLNLIVNVETAFTATGAVTLAVDFITSDVSTFSSSTTLHSVAATAKSVLVAGKNLINIPLPMGAMKRYSRLNYVTGVDTCATGKIDAFIARPHTNW